MFRLSIFFATYLLFCGIKLVAMEHHSAATEQLNSRGKIMTVINAFTTAWNENNGQGLQDLYCSDADFINIRALHFVGNVDIEGRHVRILNGFLKDSQFKVLDITLKDLAPTVVVALVEWELTNYREPESDNTIPGTTRTGTFTHVLVDNGGEWKISVSQNTLRPN